MKRSGLLAIGFLLLTMPALCQTEEEQRVLEQLDRYYERTQKEWDVPGMSVAIVKDGRVFRCSQ
jgi:hypothetical protein